MRRNVDSARMRSQTYFSNRRAEDYRIRFVHFEQDAKRALRLVAHECRTCFYLLRGGMHAQAFTSRVCDYCGEDQSFPSSDTRPLCVECAKKLRLCRRCVGDIDMNDKRRVLERKKQ